MKFLTLIFCILMSSTTYGQVKQIKANVTTQMIEDGKIDSDRLFIFYFNYLDLGSKKIDEICDVISITINNKNCSRPEMGGNKAIWLKPEYANKNYNGDDNFTCNYRKLSNETAELVITEKSMDYQITHRIISDVKNNLLIDYKGQMSKTSSITKKIETVEYKPIKAKSTQNGGWEEIEIGCNKMTIPVLPKK